MKKNDAVNQNLRFARAFDGIFLGLLVLFFLVIFKKIIEIIPVSYISYIYLVPVFFIFYNVFQIPFEGLTLFEWRKVLNRLRWSAFVTVFFSPFWAWWDKTLESSYCLINLFLLSLSASFFLFNLAGLAVVISKEKDLSWLRWLAKLTRFSVIYLMTAPILAFFIVATIGKSRGRDIFVFLLNIEQWKLLILGIPVLFTFELLWQLRKIQIVRS